MGVTLGKGQAQLAGAIVTRTIDGALFGVNPVVQGPGESRVNPTVQYSEAELGRADEPLDWTGLTSQRAFLCTPTAELAGNTAIDGGGFFFWGQNVEDDDSPDYLAITRDVVGG